MSLKPWTTKFANIIVIGMPGSGKTTFSKLYALFSGRTFLDFDDFFEKNTRKTISEVFIEQGEEKFRAMESKELRKLDRRKQNVIAMGGGTLLSNDNLAFARRLGLIVYLKTNPETLAQRIFKDQSNPAIRIRPLFDQDTTQEKILERINTLFSERETQYEKADIILPTDYSSLDNLVAQLAAIEQKAQRPDYMRTVNEIMKRGQKQTPKIEENQEQEPTSVTP